MPSPLADRVRPKSIDEVCGQHHLLDEGKVLRRIIESGQMPNLIFYGPSGVGKTTVANIIAEKCGFSCLRSFNREFIKQVGVSPTRFKKEQSVKQP